MSYISREIHTRRCYFPVFTTFHCRYHLAGYIAGSAATIAIVPATPVGKWENPGVSLGMSGVDPSVAVVAPSVGEKGEVTSDYVGDSADSLVSSSSVMLGSPAIENKLRPTASSIESVSSAGAIAKVATVYSGRTIRNHRHRPSIMHEARST